MTDELKRLTRAMEQAIADNDFQRQEQLAREIGEAWGREALDEVNRIKCPKCQGEIEITKGGFIERGEWHGDRYEDEFDVSGYLCKTPGCQTLFFME